MQENIQEIYHQNIRPLTDSEQLKLASLILEKVTGKGSNGNKNGAKRSIRELFGKGHSGDPSGADNEIIDVDLTRAYLDTHDDEK
ncbi:MAG: hypothetical protein ACR2M8_10720 [Pyrinomonadaceae bacterium]